MQAIIQAIIQWYFGILHSAGLVGVVILQVVLPPALNPRRQRIAHAAR